jgi:hypothetical protein
MNYLASCGQIINNQKAIVLAKMTFFFMGSASITGRSLGRAATRRARTRISTPNRTLDPRSEAGQAEFEVCLHAGTSRVEGKISGRKVTLVIKVPLQQKG